MKNDKKDKRVWKGDEKLEYTMSLTYKRVWNKVRGKIRLYMYDIFWKIRTLPTILFYVRIILLNKLVTLDNFYNKKYMWIIRNV